MVGTFVVKRLNFINLSGGVYSEVYICQTSFIELSWKKAPSQMFDRLLNMSLIYGILAACNLILKGKSLSGIWNKPIKVKPRIFNSVSIRWQRLTFGAARHLNCVFSRQVTLIFPFTPTSFTILYYIMFNTSFNSYWVMLFFSLLHYYSVLAIILIESCFFSCSCYFN